MSADIPSVKFRASSVGNLLVGGNAITEKQLARISELQQRQREGSKPLTANMQEELSELIAKRDGEFEFGATALKYIRDVWLKNTFEYEEPLVTNEMLKGLMCEEEAIGVLVRNVPGGFRVKNEESWSDDHFVGTPDIVLDDIVEDIKCSWSLRTFVETTEPDLMYRAQGQVYMALTGASKFRLAHVLLDTPHEIVEEEKKRFYFRFNCDEENRFYQDAVSKVMKMHTASRLIAEKDRVKTFEIDRDDRYIDRLRERVELARKVYASMTLGGENE